MPDAYIKIFGLTCLVVFTALITFINIRFYIKAKRIHKILQRERALLLKNKEEINSIEKRITVIKEEIMINEERLSSIEKQLVGIPVKAVLLLFKPSDN